MPSLKGCEVGEDGVVTATYLATFKPNKDAAAVQGVVSLAAHADDAQATLSIR
jgi:hypothetical protein